MDKIKPGGYYCVVPNCHSNYSADKDSTSFFSFPTRNLEQRQLWIEAIKREPQWVPSKYSKICSHHFVGGKHSPTRGHPSYFPTIFRPKTEKMEAKKEKQKKECTIQCCVDGCHSSYWTGQMYTFPHRNDEQRQMWIEAVKKHSKSGNFAVKQYSAKAICRLHFVGGRKSPSRPDVNYAPTIFPRNFMCGDQQCKKCRRKTKEIQVKTIFLWEEPESNEPKVEETEPKLESVEPEMKMAETEMEEENWKDFHSMETEREETEEGEKIQTKAKNVEEDPLFDQFLTNGEVKLEEEISFCPPNILIAPKNPQLLDEIVPKIWLQGCEYRCQYGGPSCNLYFSAVHLKRHIKKCHKSVSEYRKKFGILETKEVWYDCELCGQRVKMSWTYVQKHWKAKHAETPMEVYKGIVFLANEHVVSAQVKRWANKCHYVCKLCHKTENSFEAMQRHLKAKHFPDVKNNGALTNFMMVTICQMHPCLICHISVIHDLHHLKNHVSPHNVTLNRYFYEYVFKEKH